MERIGNLTGFVMVLTKMTTFPGVATQSFMMFHSQSLKSGLFKVELFS